jgi:hypothetical protein
MKHLLFLLLLATTMNVAAQRTHRVPPGNIPQINMQAGDSILFQRGGTYYGTLGIGQRNVYVGTYGTGPAPILSGTSPIAGWTRTGTVWKAPMAQRPTYIMRGNDMVSPSRFPASGWHRNAAGSKAHLTSSALTQAAGYWNGTRVVIRTTNYSYEARLVKGSPRGRLDFDAIQVDLKREDWGFAIEGHPDHMAPGQWAWKDGHIYFNSTTAPDLRVSTVEKGIDTPYKQAGVTIEGLTLQGYLRHGISVNVSDRTTVKGCTIRHCYQGISASGTGNSYLNNTIHDTYGAGMNIYCNAAKIEGNTLRDIAVRPGWGEDHWGYFGMVATGANCTVKGNTLERIGYIGIGVGGNTLCENNVVKDALHILNDGAAITFDNCDGVIVRGNTVDGLTGKMESVARPESGFHIHWNIAFGIYHGNRPIINTIVENNTVKSCASSGIHVDHNMANKGNIHRGNKISGCATGISFSDFSNNFGPQARAPFVVPVRDNIIEGNEITCTSEQQVYRFHEVYSTPVDWGTFRGNKYIHPGTRQVELRSPGKSTRFVTIAAWEQEAGKVGSGTLNGGSQPPVEPPVPPPVDPPPAGDTTCVEVTGPWAAGPWTSGTQVSTRTITRTCTVAASGGGALDLSTIAGPFTEVSRDRIRNVNTNARASVEWRVSSMTFDYTSEGVWAGQSLMNESSGRGVRLDKDGYWVDNRSGRDVRISEVRVVVGRKGSHSVTFNPPMDVRGFGASVGHGNAFFGVVENIKTK